MPTISRPALLVEKFNICVALFPKDLSMLHSSSGLQFHCRIHPFRKDTLSLEVHNLKEIPALSCVNRSCSEPHVFPCCFSYSCSYLKRLMCWREAWAPVFVLFGNWVLNSVERVSDLTCSQPTESTLFIKERRSSGSHSMFHLGVSGIQD